MTTELPSWAERLRGCCVSIDGVDKTPGQAYDPAILRKEGAPMRRISNDLELRPPLPNGVLAKDAIGLGSQFKFLSRWVPDVRSAEPPG